MRNAQRRSIASASSARGERVRVLPTAPERPIRSRQKRSNALGHPIHPHARATQDGFTALNSGVPLALTGNSDIASQFDSFTRRILDQGADAPAAPVAKRNLLGLEKLASIW